MMTTLRTKAVEIGFESVMPRLMPFTIIMRKLKKTANSTHLSGTSRRPCDTTMTESIATTTKATRRRMFVCFQSGAGAASTDAWPLPLRSRSANSRRMMVMSTSAAPMIIPSAIKNANLR